MPDFNHTFDPANAAPGGPIISLTTREIEDAALNEILQTPGVPIDKWGIFDALLDPGNQMFVFREPLGQSREVKTAISGLFGRFVARAYGTRYLGFQYFTTIANPPMTLSSVRRGMVERCPGATGDLPDWVTWNTAGQLAIVEAKGTNNVQGPYAALGHAYEQAHRVEIRVDGRMASFKGSRLQHAGALRTQRRPSQ